MVQLVLLYIILLEVVEPINDVNWWLTVLVPTALTSEQKLALLQHVLGSR